MSEERDAAKAREEELTEKVRDLEEELKSIKNAMDKETAIYK